MTYLNQKKLNILSSIGITHWTRQEKKHNKSLSTNSTNKVVFDDNKVVELAQMHQAIQSCTKCSLSKFRTKVVFGTGSPSAKIFFLGEAPGESEDQIGEPFVGRAGRLLDKTLLALGYGRESVYIANVVKCRPPNNRDPLPVEVTTCNEYLKQQINIIRPMVIVALGLVSAKTLLNSSESLMNLRNKVQSYEGIPVLTTYHPAFLLRSPSYKSAAWEDLWRAKKIIDRVD